MKNRALMRRLGALAQVGSVSLILACGGDGGGGPTSPPPTATPPGAPTITAIAAGDGSLAVTFSPPTSTGSSAITGYTATCSASGQTTRTATGAASPLTVTGLTNGTAYSCSVTATSAAGTGQASAASSGTPRSPVTAPGAPTITSIAAGDASLAISFTAPSSNGGSAITGYTGSCTAAGATKTGTASASPVTVSGVTNGTAYSCTVAATNAAGTGSPSAPMTATPVAASFSLTSVAGLTTGEMDVAYTCDGSSVSPPVAWSAGPAGTTSFALVMSTQPVTGAAKYNWLLYNMPATTRTLASGSTSVGTFGYADDGGGLAYAAPCSPGPGPNSYRFTLYALSGAPNLAGYSANQVTGAVLTSALVAVTLASVNVTLTVTRTQASINCTQVRTSLADYAAANSLSVTCDATYAYINTYGIQTKHAMMNGITATNQQVPLAQNFTGTNAWRIPLIPAVAATKTSAVDGPIGIAVNGVPLFNPCKQGGCTAPGGGDTKVLGELDLCNGHAGRADDYHYHAAPTCMMADKSEHYWDSHPIGWALDGYGIFGYFNLDGTTATRDSVCGGNTLEVRNAPSGYAYHVTDVSPYILSCFYGSPSPDLASQGGKYSPVRPPGTPIASTSMTLNATAASLAIGGTTTMQWTSAGKTYQILYKRTSTLCWNFIFKTDGTQTSTADYCRQF